MIWKVKTSTFEFIVVRIHSSSNEYIDVLKTIYFRMMGTYPTIETMNKCPTWSIIHLAYIVGRYAGKEQASVQ